jgi:hypothetical protein
LVRLPADGVESFQRYEEQVLPLLANHSGRLERRLRSSDGLIEVTWCRPALARTAGKWAPPEPSLNSSVAFLAMRRELVCWQEPLVLLGARKRMTRLAARARSG